MEGNAVPYQAAMRAVGAWLDGQRASAVRVIEDGNGMHVHYREQPQDRQLRAEFLPLTDLLSLAQQLTHKRRRRPLFSSRTSAIVRDSSYENMFRALGFELDQSRASTILVDENDDGFLVTYQFFAPRHGYGWRKHMVVLGRDETIRVLTAAAARRTNTAQNLAGLLAG